MKIKLTLGLCLIACASIAQVDMTDSAQLHDAIVGTVNTGIALVPDVNPTVSVVKAIFISIGTFVTGWCIHYFKKNKK